MTVPRTMNSLLTREHGKLGFALNAQVHEVESCLQYRAWEKMMKLGNLWSTVLIYIPLKDWNTSSESGQENLSQPCEVVLGMQTLHSLLSGLSLVLLFSFGVTFVHLRRLKLQALLSSRSHVLLRASWDSDGKALKKQDLHRLIQVFCEVGLLLYPEEGWPGMVFP